nr:hypothetical protein [Propionicimonas sp.]
MLPLAVFAVHSDGTMTVTVDGTPFEPEPPDRAWRRESVATILDTLTSQWGCPLRVEVRETDGTVFTDILTPTDRPNREPSATAQAAPRYPDSLHSEGLVPGEDVAIAVVIGHGQAGSDGTVGGLPTAVQAAASASGELILHGQVSGAHTVGPHP